MLAETEGGPTGGDSSLALEQGIPSQVARPSLQHTGCAFPARGRSHWTGEELCWPLCPSLSPAIGVSLSYWCSSVDTFFCISLNSSLRLLLTFISCWILTSEAVSAFFTSMKSCTVTGPSDRSESRLCWEGFVGNGDIWHEIGETLEPLLQTLDHHIGQSGCNMKNCTIWANYYKNL